MMSGHGWPCLIQGVVGLLSFCSSDVRPAGLALVVFLGLYLSVAYALLVLSGRGVGRGASL